MSERVVFEAIAALRDGGLIGLDYPGVGPLLLKPVSPVNVRIREAYGPDAKPVRVRVTVERIE